MLHSKRMSFSPNLIQGKLI